jgi:hypothetical protein
MLLSSLSVLFHFYVVYSASCGCSSVNIPVHVDTLVLQDPTDPFASSLRRVDAIYNVYGVFCQPNTVSHKRVGQS